MMNLVATTMRMQVHQSFPFYLGSSCSQNTLNLSAHSSLQIGRRTNRWPILKQDCKLSFQIKSAPSQASANRSSSDDFSEERLSFPRFLVSLAWFYDAIRGKRTMILTLGEGLDRTFQLKAKLRHIQSRMLYQIMLAIVYLNDLDITVRLPLLIFIPWCLAVQLVYGTGVTVSLFQLWILGPLIAAIYVKLVLWLYSLFNTTIMKLGNFPRKVMHNFVQAHKFAKGSTHKILNSPYRFVTMVYKLIVEIFRFLFEGRFLELLHFCLWTTWQTVLTIVKMCKEIPIKMVYEIKEMIRDKYFDLLESIWPFYLRTLRFLKRARII